MIAAVARNGIIGRDGALPWRLPEDMKHFRRTTMGKPVIMGRRTFESLGRALPGRENIVVSRDPDFEARDCEVARSVAEALERCAGREETVVIGGASLYAECLPLADRLYLTRVHADFEGDTRFPDLDPNEWREVERRDFEADAKHAQAFSILTLERSR